MKNRSLKMKNELKMKNHEKKIWYKIPLPFLSQKHQKTHFKKVVPTDSYIDNSLSCIVCLYGIFKEFPRCGSVW